MTRILRLILLLALSALPYSLLFSQEATGKQAVPEHLYPKRLEKEVTEEPHEFGHSLEIFSKFMPASGVRSMPGKIEISRTQAEYNYEFKLFEELPVELSLYKEYTAIHNTTDIPFPSRLNGIGLGIETTLPFFAFRDTYFRLGVTPSFYTATAGSFPSSSFRIPSQYFLIYNPDDSLLIVAGIEVAPDYKDEVWPILGVVYKPNDRLTFDIIPERPNISYNLNQQWSIFAEGWYTSEEYEVTRNNVKGVVLMYDDAFAGGGLRFTPNKNIRCAFSAGGVFGRQLKYRDKRGKANIKDGFYTEFKLEIEI